MTDSERTRLVWLLPIASAGLVAGSLFFWLNSPAERRELLPDGGALFVAWAGIGALILTRLPNHPIGWLVAGVGIAAPLSIAGDAYAAVEPALPVRDWIYLVSLQAGAAIGACAVLLLLLYPTGRLLSRRWRSAVFLLAVAQLLLAIGLTISRYPSSDSVEEYLPGEAWLDNPLGTISDGHPLYGGGLGWPLFLLAAVAGFVALVMRFRKSPEQRQQIKWLILPASLLVLGWVAMNLEGEVVQPLEWLADGGLLYIGLMSTPIVIGAAILRHRLLDIDLLIRRSLVYGVLWLAIGGLYLAAAALPGVLVGARLPVEVAVGLTVVATLAFQPARRAVDRVVGRLVFGERPSEMELLTRFGAEVADSSEGELAPRLAETVRQSLDVLWARVSLELGPDALSRPAGAAGITSEDPETPALVVPLTYHGARLGAIECGPNRDGRFTERDRELLVGLAHQAALGIHNAHLAAELSASLDEIRRQTSELAASRARIVVAQDAERQRLERDLHDGIQQQIVSLLARLGLARTQMGRDPASAERTLTDLQTQTTQVLQDLRAFVRGIHPPVLTDRGLLEAIEARISEVPLGIELRADPDLRERRFASKVETAAYFFVAEALTNVMKHARASQVVIRLTEADGDLAVEVADDGVGFQEKTVMSSGLTGLRDRIEAVGGRMSVDGRPGQGSILRASIPVTATRTDTPEAAEL